MNTNNAFVFTATTTWQGNMNYKVEKAIGVLFDDKGKVVSQFGIVRTSSIYGTKVGELDPLTDLTDDNSDLITGASQARSGARLSDGLALLYKYLDFISIYEPSPYNPFYVKPPSLNAVTGPHR
jgi:hypothetical protein